MEDQDPLGKTLQWLSEGEIELAGRFVQSWNYVFLAQIDDGVRQGLAVYKPCAGEYPLWDFENATLCLREVAAYRLSQVLGWPLIPPTVLREGPYGLGMVQLYIEADPEVTYFTLKDDRLADLLPVALFDHVTNNADRKGGHLLLDDSGRIWAIDHALTFHAEPKLRTVIWDFAGEPIPAPYLSDLEQLCEELGGNQPLGNDLAQFLSLEELDALQQRVEHLLRTARFPHPDPDRRHVPWPLI